MINSDIPEDSNDNSDEGNQKENEITTNENSSDLTNLAEDDEQLLLETEDYIGTNEEEEDSLLNGTDATQDIPSSSNDGMDLLEDQENTEDAAAEINDAGHATSNKEDITSSSNSNDNMNLLEDQENTENATAEKITDNDDISTVANNVEDVSKDNFDEPEQGELSNKILNDDNTENSNVATRTKDEVLEHNISSADDDNLLGKEIIENSDLIDEEASNTADGGEINPSIEMDETSTELESDKTKNSNLQIMVGIDGEDANDAFVPGGLDDKDTNNKNSHSNDENENAD